MQELLVRAVPEDVDQLIVEAAGLDVRILRKGSGPDLMILHDSLGNLGWLRLYEELSETFTVWVPDMPGYGASARPEWARSPRDLALLISMAADALGLERMFMVGLGFGGFVASELATMDRSRVESLTLVGPTGIRPRQGEIADQMFMGFATYGISAFRDAESFQEVFGSDTIPPDVYECWDLSSEMTARVCWKPWMFSLQLPHLLGAVKAPTLVVWAESDRLVPRDVAEQYAELVPGRAWK